MGLKNFIKEGTYLRFERIGYSKHGRNADASIIVYDGNKIILTTNISISCNINAVHIDKVINEEDDLLEIAPEFLSMKDGESYYINLTEASTPYINDINHKIVYKAKDGILFSQPEYIYFPETKETFERNEDGYSLIQPHELKTIQQFDSWFDPSNPTKSLYEYIKKLSAYKDCIDA